MNITAIHGLYASLAAERNGLIKACDWDSFCQTVEDQTPAIRGHLETWGPHCGAPRYVYRGHLVRLLLSLAEPLPQKDPDPHA